MMILKQAFGTATPELSLGTIYYFLACGSGGVRLCFALMELAGTNSYAVSHAAAGNEEEEMSCQETLVSATFSQRKEE
jgi:hypothetical protein